MGAWGIDSFANDDALDWVAELRASGLQAAGAAFDEVLAMEGDLIEAPVASRAVAAAEVVAAAAGQPGPDLPPDVKTWLAANATKPPAGLRANAQKAVILLHQESELRDLWFEGRDGPKWSALVEGLIRRLS